VRLRLWTKPEPGVVEFLPDLAAYARRRPVVGGLAFSFAWLACCITIGSVGPLLVWLLR
jgi:hypothetical protein